MWEGARPGRSEGRFISINSIREEDPTMCNQGDEGTVGYKIRFRTRPYYAGSWCEESVL